MAHCGHDTTNLIKADKEVNQEVKLYQALNAFIGLVSNQGNDSATSGSTKNSVRTLSNFLRLNLLSYLRHCQQLINKATVHREVLIQWWVTLLNFLNSELIVNARNKEGESLQHPNFSDPMWNTDTVSVCLECVSRLMSTLIVLPVHHYKETEIYSHHILLTIHCVTNQIIFNSKHIRILDSDKSENNRRYLHFLKSYSTLLRAFLGKLNAYAFFYLPDDFHYDTQLLLVTCPQLTFEETQHPSLFPWKRRKFGIIDDESKKINTDELENRDTRFFKIVVSYMKNESIFIAFYWHYWYIILRFASLAENFEDLGSNLDMIPGAEVLLNQVTFVALEEDFQKMNNFLKATHLKGSHSSTGMVSLADAMPNSTTSTVPNDNILTAEILNDFVFTNFRIIRLWESLRSLSGCFDGYAKIANLLALHDSFQLRFVSSISAYDGNVANVIYNKILQFIIFQFNSVESIDFINWNIWCSGLLSLLQTLSANCQIVALICLFNIWEYLPIDSQKRMSQKLVNDLWNMLSLDSDFHLVKIIFFKLLVFRILPNGDSEVNEDLKAKLKLLYGEMLSIFEDTNATPQIEKVDVLTFYGNRKFFLLPNKCLAEDVLIGKLEKQMRLKTRSTSRNFPSVISVANTRPSFIFKNGRYPYDVFDEMVVKATLLLSEKKRREADSPLPPIRHHTNVSSSDQFKDSNTKSTKPASLSSTIGSWLTKLSPKAAQNPNGASKLAEGSKSITESPGSKSSRSTGARHVSSETSLPHSESAEILSMYSNVSSLATGNSSIEEQQTGVKDNDNGRRGTGTLYTANVFREGKSIEKNEINKRIKSKKKLLSPVELKYSSPIVDGDKKGAILLKPVIIPCDSITKKIEKANNTWLVTTARTYEKPLPIPNSDEIDSVIEDLHYDTFGIGTGDAINFEAESSEPVMTLQSSSSVEQLIPFPKLNLIGATNINSHDSGTGDSALLKKFRDITLGTKEYSSKCNDNDQTDIMLHCGGKSCDNLRKSETMLLKTRLDKIATAIRIFNKTVEERFEFLNFSDQESLFMDFEVRPPTYSTSTNVV